RRRPGMARTDVRNVEGEWFQMALSERPEAPPLGARLSLVLPLSKGRVLTEQALAEYRRVLAEQRAFDSIEVIIAASANGGGEGHRSPDLGFDGDGGTGSTHIKAEEGDWSALARAGLAAASGGYLIVLDVDRLYSPESLIRVIHPVWAGSCD